MKGATMVTKEFDITVDTSIISTFRGMPLEMYKVFMECIDNALQSYLDHKKVLDELPDSPKKLVVEITWTKTEIQVRDNAWGMNEEAFQRALKLNKPSARAKEDDRLSVFGMGLKTAACYASSDYFIYSTEYGSGTKYKAEMDVDYISMYAPKTCNVTIEEAPLEEHGTIIRMKKLNKRCLCNADSEKKVLAKLARIYHPYLYQEQLEIILNGIRVKYEEPTFLQDPHTGSDAVVLFSNNEGIEFEGERYRYEGWVAVVKKGDSSGETTGFDYYQAKRAIVLSDHPHELFGGNNDARFQHVYGQIQLFGNQWPVTVNKDTLQWSDNGLHDALIQDILRQENVRRLFELAKKTKYRALSSANPGSQNSLSGDISGFAPGAPNPFAAAGSQTGLMDSAQKGPTSFTTIPTPAIKQTKVTKKLTFKETVYDLDLITFEGDPDQDWFTLKRPEGEANPNHLVIEINMSAPLAAKLNSPTGKKVFDLMAEVIVIARMEATKSGLKLNDSFAIEQAINEIMRKAKC